MKKYFKYCVTIIMLIILFCGCSNQIENGKNKKPMKDRLTTNFEKVEEFLDLPIQEKIEDSTTKIENEVYEDLYFQFNQEDAQIGVTDSIIIYEENLTYTIHYPLIGKESIDEDIRQQIESYVADFKAEFKNYKAKSLEERAELHIDYKTYLVANNIMSLFFNISYEAGTYANPFSKIITSIYNVETGEKLDASAILKEGYLDKLSTYVREYYYNHPEYKDNLIEPQFTLNTEPVAENFSRFIIKEGTFVFFFEKYSILPGYFGSQYIEIPESVLEDYILYNIAQKVEIPEVVIDEVEEVKQFPEIDLTKPMVALTFDDGPSNTYTNQILDVLEQYNAKATFFVLGNRVGSYPKTLQRAYSLGCEIGSHTYNHKNLTKLSIEDIKWQVTQTSQSVEAILSTTPKLVRPPYGSFNDIVKQNVNSPIILWSIDTLDWKTRNKDSVVKAVLNKVQDGDIILMHDIYQSSADAAAVIIPELIERGYQLVTVSELGEYRRGGLQDGSVYGRMKPN